MLKKKSYKFRIYPSKNQEKLINKTIGSCRFVFNYFLSAQRKQENYFLLVDEMVQQGYFQENNWRVKPFNKNKFIKELVNLKKNNEWLKEVDSIALQSSVENLYVAYERFYKSICGKPKFKSKKNLIQSYTTKMVNGNIKIVNDRITMPKLGAVRMRYSRKLEGEIKKATISRTKSGRYFVSILCDVDIKKLSMIDKKIGVDLGIKNFAVCSDGYEEHNPKYFRKLELRIAKLQRDLSRKKYNSKNYQKNRKMIAKLYERITNQRKDFLHKFSTKLIRENQSIAIEDLNIVDLIKNNKLTKEILGASFREFRMMLQYKADWYGREIIIAPSEYPSSQLCSKCRYKNIEMKNLGLREWVCPKCKTHHDRDFNAALNLESLIV